MNEFKQPYFDVKPPSPPLSQRSRFLHHLAHNGDPMQDSIRIEMEITRSPILRVNAINSTEDDKVEKARETTVTIAHRNNPTATIARISAIRRYIAITVIWSAMCKTVAACAEDMRRWESNSMLALSASLPHQPFSLPPQHNSPPPLQQLSTRRASGM